jgi:cholest-4-en-3-one 26-monooxygenase
MADTDTLDLATIDIHSTNLLESRGYPWEAWDLLRREAPVFWYERDDIAPFWAITRYDDIHWVGSNDKLFVNGGGRLRLASLEDDAGAADRARRRIEMAGWDLDEVPDLVYMDKPRHTAFRNLSARSFTPKSMRQLEEHLDQYARRFTAEFVATLEEQGTADLVEDFAVKLPLATICDLMGLPVDDWADVHRMTGMFMAGPDAMRHARPGETWDELRMRTALEFQDYTRSMVERARECPVTNREEADLTQKVVHGEVGGCPLTDQQLHGYLMLLIGAGNETTRNATTRGVTALLEHRDQIDRLLERPDLVETAVEEILRWTSPVIQFARTATADVELHGQQIRAGDTVGVFYPSANRDEDVFPDPYHFDVGRQPNYHMAFGHGAHFCLGANLARWELRAMLRELLPVLPRLELAGEPERGGHLHLGLVKHQAVALAR